eukprot:CAMPEP_0172715228 /NCGR_PEP_ID=MMETSP1074-20121228/67428_1 /TAXON_ID=2916 /ORGANISM="Ceratium fusus, Strain PA161109" /LENGTH=48 /DNA_ID= /DNA_START= /DNA_END= /DNA_ORIENTATION=
MTTPSLNVHLLSSTETLPLRALSRNVLAATWSPASSSAHSAAAAAAVA